MLPSSKTLLLLLFSFSFFSSTFADSAISESNNTTVYELLPQFGLPSGLLPDSVQNFSLSDDGKFVVELEKPCYIQFDYLVYYDRRITGTIKYGSISDLKGIQVKRLFLWFDVDEIKVDLPPSDSIYFEVGWITKKLQIAQFKDVRSCKDKGLLQGVCKGLLRVPAPVREATLLITE
ncbi:uncharacterized protein LOC143845893 [Tasmannia lanceolata]|uniref:uncharacterized protein LOC143845893 n=1 Tax=Tasmannia lanceolata TaxID=3420 RepID=UPI004062DAFF